jgi:hypothetical protein
MYKLKVFDEIVQFLSSSTFYSQVYVWYTDSHERKVLTGDIILTCRIMTT